MDQPTMYSFFWNSNMLPIGNTQHSNLFPIIGILFPFLLETFTIHSKTFPIQIEMFLIWMETFLNLLETNVDQIMLCNRQTDRRINRVTYKVTCTPHFLTLDCSYRHSGIWIWMETKSTLFVQTPFTTWKICWKFISFQTE